MYVYILYKSTLRRIPGVGLRGYSVPEICGRLEERLDPSLWYKTLVLDALFVDCDVKNVFYTGRAPPQREDIHGYRQSQLSPDLVRDFFKDKERVFSEDEYPEYDPTFDDLFTTAHKLLQDLTQADDEDNATKYEHLFKLLHVFVLPKLKLDTSDKDKVEKVLADIEKFHEETENEIQFALKSERNTENSLNEQTKQLLRKEDEFCRDSYVAACHHEFIGVFLERLDKHIAKCREDFQIYAEKIEPMRESEVEEDLKKLKLMRSERNLIREGFDRALKVREEIRKKINQKSSVYENINQLSFGFQNSYVKTFRCLQMKQEEMPKMIRKKIKISAVREAVVLTLREINTDGNSYGYNRAKGSFDVDTDVLDLNQVPDEWASLPAKIKHLVEKPDGQFEAEHSEFCEKIKNDCQQLLNASGAGGLNPGNFHLDRHSAKSYASRWSRGCISEESCQGICNKVTDHISDMVYKLSQCDDLVNEFTQNRQNTTNKVYMCYGEKVTAELLPILSRMYEESYRAQFADLSRFLTTVIIHEVFSGELKMLNDVLFKQKKKSPSKDDKAKPSDEEETPYEPVSYEDQRVTLPIRPSDSEYESMEYLQAQLRYENSCTLLPDAQEGTDVPSCSSGEPAHDNNLSPNPVIIRQREVSSRKRQGVTLTTSQAEKLLVEIPDGGDGWLSTDGYVDMNRLSRASRMCAISLNRFYSEFSDFQFLVKAEIAATTMNAKLRSMTGILKYVERRLTDLKSAGGHSDPACADDLVSVIVLLLLKLETDDLLKLYSHINLLDHLCPNFMMGNIHCYALITVQGPYHVLFEQARLRQC